MDIHFARSAAGMLEKGKMDEALHLCEEGVATFPWYATGHLILGKVYDSMHRPQEGLLAYRKALAILPDVPHLQGLVRDAEHATEGGFEAFAQEQEKRLAGTKGSLTVDQFLRDEATPLPVPDQPVSSERRTRIVTPTLAEIYASQGEFKEAIDAYQTLAERKPEQELRFRERIKQLQELARKREEGTA
jgi:cytochrome c-type biogenesis protein CcmH/NrfG